MTRTWEHLAARALATLREAGISGAEREVRWLVEEGKRTPRAGRGFVTVIDDADDADASEAARDRFESMVARRAAGEPLQYVIGHWPFRTLELLVDARALIPRPETELVGQAALDELAVEGCSHPVVVDLGTGSGALALAIAVEYPSARVIGVDASPDALALASRNRDRLGLDAARVELVEGSWFAPLDEIHRGAVDLIVTNPPYVATGDQIDEVVRAWEPSDALFAGPDGLDDLRVIIAGSPEWLTSNGVLVAEIGATQAAAVIDAALAAGFAHAEVRRDLAGRDRILVARRKA